MEEAGKQSDPQQGHVNMNRLKIGIRLESLGLPLRRALREAQQLGVRGGDGGRGWRFIAAHPVADRP